MTKQSPIEALQQQLTQIEDLTEKQLNGLLQRLESQKTKLPLEDHAIIDWGISLIRAKVREEELLKNRMSEYLANKYSNYETFVEKSGWRNFILSNSEDENSLCKLGWNNLNEIVKLSYKFEDHRLLQYARFFKQYLQRFCVEQGSEDSLFPNLIKTYTKECNTRSNEPELAEYYRRLRELLV